MRLPQQMFVGSRPLPGLLNPPKSSRYRHWKPAGGIWTSTASDGTSGWIEWCEGEDFRTWTLSQRWLLDPVDARVFAILDADDVDRLFANYGRPIYDDPVLSSPLFDFLTVDWEAFVVDWDALWLSSPWIDCGGMPLRMASMMFYGWDCESTWWARWKFDGVQRA
jgi:hypothetical protein